VQKIRNQKFSAVSKKSKVNFLLEVIIIIFLFEQRAFKHIFPRVLMQMCAFFKERTRGVIDYVFCALCMFCPGSAVKIRDGATSWVSSEHPMQNDA